MFAWDRLPVAVVAMGTAIALWATGVLDVQQAVGGFGDRAVIFIASLFVVSEGLEATGVTAWLGQQLVVHAGESRTRLIVLATALVAGLTALISVNGAVAAFAPVATVAAVRVGRSPSQLLMPVAFAAHAGSLLTFTGTPVNVIVSEASVDAGTGKFGYFAFALVGTPLLVGTVAIIVLFGERLLPARDARRSSRNFSAHARTLVAQYDLDHEDAMSLMTRRAGLAEIIIPPRSDLIGEAVYPGMVSDNGEFVVLAIQRKGEDQDGKETRIAEGDTLLLQGPWEALEERLDEPDVIAVDEPRLVRRQAVPLGAGAWEAIALLAAMVVLLATGAVPAVMAGLLAAGGMIILRVLSIEDAYSGISWTTVILVAGMIPLSTAMTESGAARILADKLVAIVGDASPHVLLLGLFVLTAILGQLISNMATALIVIPIGLSAARDLAISPRPVLMCVAVAAAAAFLTPVATPANLMVMGPAGYRFGDYWKLGLPLLFLFGLVSVLLVPVFWSF